MRAFRSSLSMLGLCALLACASSEDRRRYAAGQAPPSAFVADGCSMAPDLDVGHCCETHDRAYWQGGSCAARHAADAALRSCIRTAGRPVLGSVYQAGVRIGGWEWWPTSWRWGFGWPYGISCRSAN